MGLGSPDGDFRDRRLHRFTETLSSFEELFLRLACQAKDLVYLPADHLLCSKGKNSSAMKPILTFYSKSFVLLLTVAGFGVVAVSQGLSPDGQVTQENGKATISVDYVRPLEAITKTLAKEYGLLVTFEEAPLIYSGDRSDVAESQAGRGRYFNPRGGRLTLSLETTPDGKALKSPAGSVAQIVAAYNQSGYPGRYKLLVAESYLQIVPVARADARGVMEQVQSPLDAVVTIKANGRSPHSILRELVRLVSEQSGFEIRIGRSPFLTGDQKAVQKDFSREPARAILRALVEASNKPRIWYLLFDIRSGVYYLSII